MSNLFSRKNDFLKGSNSNADEAGDACFGACRRGAAVATSLGKKQWAWTSSWSDPAHGGHIVNQLTPTNCHELAPPCLFGCNQPTIFFSYKISINQSIILIYHNKSAPTTSHGQPKWALFHCLGGFAPGNGVEALEHSGRVMHVSKQWQKQPHS